MKISVSIVLIFLLFSIPSFALESDPSETVGYVKYECLTTATSTNLNLIALPMDSGITDVTELVSEIGVTDAISVWNPTAQNWTTSIFFFGNWTPNTALSPGDVVLVSVTDEVDFYSAGGLPTPAQYDLETTVSSTNLNNIMIPLNRSDITDVSDFATDIGVADAVSLWNPTAQNWTTSIFFFGNWTPDSALDIAMPMQVSVTSDVTWPTRGQTNDFVPELESQRR